MLFTEEFIGSLKDDPVNGTIKICEIASEATSKGETWTESDYDILIEAFALLQEMKEMGILPMISRAFPAPSNQVNEDCMKISKYLEAAKDECIFTSRQLKATGLRSRMKVLLGAGFSYEFSQGDLELMQMQTNRLRELIASSKQLDREHQQRLLHRLERLQSEMHKKVSDLDRFWGLIGDAGVVMGKLGKDAKPIVDTIRDITNIVWQTQSRAEELPSGTHLPMLESDQSDDGK
jgi:hypothetical protein